MFKNFKFISKNFALKLHRKPKLCNTINFTTEFYTNIILLQKDELKYLLQNKQFHLDPRFLNNAYKINKLYEDDEEIYGLIQEKLVECASKGGIKTKSIYFELFETFFENLKNNPDHPLSKQLLQTLEKQSHLFTEKDKEEIKSLLTKKKSEMKKSMKIDKNMDESDENISEEEMEKDQENSHKKQKQKNPELEDSIKIKKNQKINEISRNIVQEKTSEESGKIFLKNNIQGLHSTPINPKLKLKDENLNLFLEEGKNKITLKSKHFKSNVKIYGINDNSSESVMQSLEIVDKNFPTTIIFQKRPLHYTDIYNTAGMDMLTLDEDLNKLKSKKSSQYISLLERSEIINYCKNFLENKKSKFKINSVERLVYEEVDTFKTISFVQSLILKIKNNLNSNPFVKIIFSDLPHFEEIEFIIETMNHNNNSNLPRDFFKFMKLNFLFEKFLWLIEVCGYRCPTCDKGLKFEMAHLKNENLIVDYYLSSLMNIEHLKVKNISDKILKSIKLNDHKDNTIIAFVEENYFYPTLERVIKDINYVCEGKDLETIENIFTKKSENFEKISDEFNHNSGDWNKLIENFKGDKKEILNKIAIGLNVYNLEINEIEKTIKEFAHLKEEDKNHLKDLFLIYRERLNYVEEINLWNARKYDYKCYPNEILINKFLDSGKNI